MLSLCVLGDKHELLHLAFIVFGVVNFETLLGQLILKRPVLTYYTDLNLLNLNILTYYLKTQLVGVCVIKNVFSAFRNHLKAA